MNSERNTARLAGILLVTSFILFLFHIVVDMTQGVEAPSIFSHCLYGLVVSAAGLALYLVFREHDPILPTFVGFWFAAAGLFLLLQGNMVFSGLVFSEDFSFIPTVTSPVPLSSLEIAANKIGRSGYICQGLGVLTLGVLLLRTGAIARWIGWLGCAAGVLALLFGLLGMAGLLDDTASAIGFLLLGPVHFVFILALGFRLISGNVSRPVPSN